MKFSFVLLLGFYPANYSTTFARGLIVAAAVGHIWSTRLRRRPRPVPVESGGELEANAPTDTGESSIGLCVWCEYAKHRRRRREQPEHSLLGIRSWPSGRMDRLLRAKAISPVIYRQISQLSGWFIGQQQQR